MLILRTDHNALRWLMTISDSTGRLTRWRIPLSEFDFTVKYRPGLVHQVPDALSRGLTPEGNDDKPIDDEVPSYSEHEAILVTTRRKVANVTPNRPAMMARKQITRKRTAGTPADAGRMNTKSAADLTDEERLLTEFRQNHINHNTTNDDETIEDVLEGDLNIFDMALAYQYEGRDLSIAFVPVRLTKDELLEAQSTDDFCQTVLSRLSRNLETHFFEGNDGLLRREHPTDPEIFQILVPDTLRPRVLDLAHHTIQAGHPGQTRMHRHIRETYYWPQVATDIYKKMRNCTNCAKNRVKLRKRTHPLRIFPATRPLESLAIDILGPLTKTKKGHRFLLLMSDRFSKLTHVVPLRRIDAYTIAVAFVAAWVFKYGPPKTLISDNGKQFAAKLFQAVCSLLGIWNIFISTNHPQTNGQVERYNRAILAML